MKNQIVILAFLCNIILVLSAPAPQHNQELDVFQFPLNNGRELDILELGDSDQLNDRNKRTIGILRDLFPEISKINGGDNSIDLNALNQQLEETIRVARQANSPDNNLAVSVNNQALDELNDQHASESKAPAIDELSLDSLEDADNEDRNKRQGLFGGSGGGSGGAGSGNFLFDIIRLFSGSVQTPQNDQRNNGAESTDEEGGEAKPEEQNDGYTEGIPGPVTRLVVLANRGLANLVQDLILRIAATSERLVNFKARLITALI